MSDEDELMAMYAAQAKSSIAEEANRRVAEMSDPEEEERLRNISLHTILDSEHLVPALLSRLGVVRAALAGHGGGISVTSAIANDEGNLELVLDLTGACLSCGAAPGTLQGVKGDLESDDEIAVVRFSTALLDTFDELSREFILLHGNVEFVTVE